MATETAPVTETTPPKPSVSVRSSAPPSARNRSAVLAEMEEAEAAPEPTKQPKEAPAEAKAAPPDADTDDDEIDDDKIDNDADDKPDAAADKGLERIKAAEKRMRLDIAKERETFERERTAHKTEVRDLEAKMSAFERMAARIKYDPVAVMRQLGAEDKDFDSIARALHGSSPEFAKDPRNADAVAKMLLDKEERDKLRALHERQEKLEAELAAERESAKVERLIAGFLDGVVRAVGDDAPLVQRMVTKAPQQARADLQQIAEILHQEGGDISEKNVVAMLERVMRDEAEEAGYDASALVKSKSAKPAEVEKKTAPASAAAGVKGKPKDHRASRDELVRKIEADDLT